MTIVFTGGGTVGHVSVNLALITHFVSKGWDVHYIGNKNGLEYKMVENIDKLTFHSISTGKLRRYFDLKNFTDPFRVLKGIVQSKKIINKIKPDIFFSKGGFVSFPVVVAAKLGKVKVILHESDLTPGLANKMLLPFCDSILSTFKDTEKYIHGNKVSFIGAIVRENITVGNKTKGQNICGFKNKRPILLIMGGSLGAQSINAAIRNNLNQLLRFFNIIHICGMNNVDVKSNFEGYKQYEFVKDELPDILAACDMVISRAGSNAIFEFLQLEKPMLLIPLPKTKSRGDQFYNAEYFKSKGYCDILYEDRLDSDDFINKVLDIYSKSHEYEDHMKNQTEIGSIKDIISVIYNMTKTI